MEKQAPFRVLYFEELEEDRELFDLCFTPAVHYGLFRGDPRKPLSSCQAVNPDCILLGLRLGQADGLQLLSQLRDESGPRWPVVIVTGRGSEEAAVRSFRLGAQDYVPKEDLSPESLRRTVSEAAGKFQASRRFRIRTEQLESALDQVGQLQAVSSALASGLRVKEIAEIVLEQGRKTFGADTGIVVQAPDGEAFLRVLHTVNYPPALVKSLESISASSKLPVSQSLRTGESLFLASTLDMLPFADFHGIASELGLQAFAALPLQLGGRTLAAVGFGFRQPRDFGEDERTFFNAVLYQCAQALERAQLFDQEHRSRELLSKAVRARDDFLSIASHELKTPLTAIKLQLQLARRAAAGATLDKAKVTTSYEVALRQVDRLSNFLEDLLDVSRLQSGRLTLHPEKVDFTFLARDLVSRFQEQFQIAGSSLTLETAPDQFVHGDLFRLEQVLNNLATNALKYASPSSVKLSVFPEENEVKITFSDTGPGIAPERLPVIFDRFERATSSLHVSGMGLGLFITKQLVEAQGGRIQVASELGRGTTFTLYFPSAR